MATFSQSFNLGNSTLADISKEERIALNKENPRCKEKPLPAMKEDLDLEVIDESPTNCIKGKTMLRSCSRYLKHRAKIHQTQSSSNYTTRSRRGSFKKIKSDSELNGESLAADENYSDFFKSDFIASGGANFHCPETKNCLLENSQDNSGIVKPKNFESLLNDSASASAFIEGTKVDKCDDIKVRNMELSPNEENVRISTPTVYDKPTNHDDDDNVWGMSSQFVKFDFSKEVENNDPKKNSVVDSVINIEDISFISFKEDLNLYEKEDDIKNELEKSKKYFFDLLKKDLKNDSIKDSSISSNCSQNNGSRHLRMSSIHQNVQSNISFIQNVPSNKSFQQNVPSNKSFEQNGSSNKSFQQNISSNNSFQHNNLSHKSGDDLDTFSTCNKTLLNWSSTSNEASFSKDGNKDQQGNSCETTENINKLKSVSSWSLPITIIKEYDKKGIRTMFDWQVECLSNPKVLFEHKNLVYSAPTSAGKTLISELLVIKTILERKKKVLIILPFISVVREKMYYFQDLLTSSGYRVEGFFGGYSPPGGFESIHVAICTIEKANSIVNKLLEQGNLKTIGTVVIDEIHLISDPGRGYILELLLAKLLYISRKYSLEIQIITMSATLSNVQLLQKWLNAELYITDFRPVELREMIKIGTKIYNNRMDLIREIDTSAYSIANDQDHIAHLCIETILENCSVIVFCPSKDWCETLSLNLASNIYYLGKSETDVGEKIRCNINKKALEEIKAELKNSPVGLDSSLEKTISFACAFHHAGLTTEERDIIENNFRNGVIRIIAATSTLSSGVNLPARRVIIRSPLFGGKQMNSLTYKQMIGRAGRTGKDTLGESILICTEQNARTGKDLLTCDIKPLFSCLNLDNSAHLKRALLEVISSGVASTKNDLDNFINCTLLNAQKNNDCNSSKTNSSTGSEQSTDDDPINESINFLLEYEFIRTQKNDETNEINYIATRLGMACLASSMPPSEGLILFSELQKSRKCFVLESELHAVYLVTPYSVCYQIQELDWLDFLDMWEKLSPAMKKVGELVGVKESFLVRAMRGHTKLDYKLLQIHKRFYTALALQELVNEVSINQVAIKYKCPRGLLQSLQQMSSTFAGIVTAFCNSLNWTTLGLIVSQFKERLYFGIHRDLIDLMRIPDLNTIRARALFNSGIKNLVDLANSDILDVEKILYNCISFESAKKKDDEDDKDLDKRNDMRNLYVTGKAGVTIHDAAKMLITNARQFLQYEIGVKNINWDENNTTISGNTSIKNTSLAIITNPSSSESESGKRKSPENLQSKFLKIRKNEENCRTLEEKKTKENENYKERNEATSFNSEDKLSSINIVDSMNKNKINKRESIRKSSRLLARTEKDKQDNSSSNNKENQVINKIFLNSSSNSIDLDDSSFSINTQLLEVTDNISKDYKSESKNIKGSNSNKASTNDDEGPIVINTPPNCLENKRILRSSNVSHPQNQLNEIEKNQNEKSASLEISNISVGNSLLRNPIQLNSSHILNASKLEANSVLFNCLHIIDICGNFQLFKNSLDEINNCKEISVSIGVEKFLEKRKPLIGGHLLINQQNPQMENENFDFVFEKSMYISGISITTENVGDNVVLFINMQKENSASEIDKKMKIEILQKLFMDKDKIIKMWDAKEQLKILNNFIPSIFHVKATIEDPKVASWLLQPDISTNFEQLVHQYVPEFSDLANLVCKNRASFSIGLNSKSSIKGKIRCAIESCGTRFILKGQFENLERISNGQLKKFFHELEMPIQISLFRMETLGFPVNEDTLHNLTEIMTENMKKVENKIYDLHGSRFNLLSTSSVARLLGLDKKSNGRYCTSKQILEKINSPIAELILMYRKLNVTLTKNIQPLLKCVVNNRIHGNSITDTLTGRISMHEPNLQNVAKDFEINIPGQEKITISCRSPFYPEPGKCLLSADFCQLEMRILTHLSQDPDLIKIMSSEKDVFTAIAAKWNKINENEVSDILRNGTKQICYGIIYGMGMKSLAESLKCTEHEATIISEQFHLTYPGIRAYTLKVIKYAQQKGYVETITGRRRYLEHINNPKSSLKNQAERQAVNTTIQGSAADIAKNAILRIEKNLSKYQDQLKINLPNDDERSQANFVLHLHDELIYEIPENRAMKIAKAVKISMENCVKLSIPLRVKLKIGKSWNALEEITI